MKDIAILLAEYENIFNFNIHMDEILLGNDTLGHISLPSNS